MGHSIGADPTRFHLIALYESDARRWARLRWTDQYSGKAYSVTTAGSHGTRSTARVKSYGDVLSEYEFHAESKCADATGEAAGKQRVGLLARRHVAIGLIRYIGKESNSLESVEQGSGPETTPYTEYPDQSRGQWATTILLKLKAISPKGVTAAQWAAALDASGDTRGKKAASTQSGTLVRVANSSCDIPKYPRPLRWSCSDREKAQARLARHCGASIVSRDRGTTHAHRCAATVARLSRRKLR